MKYLIILIILIVAMPCFAQDSWTTWEDSEADISAFIMYDGNGNIVDSGGDPETVKEMLKDHQAAIIENEKYYILKAKRKYINTLRGAASTISQYGSRWGLNDQYVEECRNAYNETFDINPVTGGR